MSFLSDFRKFAMRGNVVDMAVGIIIGGAFGKIVSSLVADVIMPPIGLLLSGVNFADLSVTLKQATETDPAVVISYGKFIQTVVDFIIIAFSIFAVIRVMSKLEKKKEEAPATPPAPSKEEMLLTDIRDLLKQQNSEMAPKGGGK